MVNVIPSLGVCNPVVRNGVKSAEDAGDVVAGDEDENDKHREQPAERADLEDARAERPPSEELDGEEDEMAAVENRDRQQVDEADVDREERGQQDESTEAEVDERFATDLGDLHGAGKVVEA